MGFDLRKAISRFSSKCQAQPEMGSKTVIPSPNQSSKVSTTVAVEREKKISAYNPPKKSKRREITKSVKFDDCNCNRNVKGQLGSKSGLSSSSTKSLSSSIPTSISDAKRPGILDPASSVISSIDDPLKSSSSSLGFVASESGQARLPMPGGVHSRNLSYGTIYNATKVGKPKEEVPRPKGVRQNASVVKDANFSDSKLGRSLRHSFGLGGCSYGHGSIINGIKTMEKDPDSGSKFQDSALEKQSSNAGSSLTLAGGNVEELKNAGNREYKKGLFENAISLYDKAIDLNPQDASCHHNKAAALTSLGRIKEAVEECIVAVNCNPSYVRAHYRLGNLYTRLGQVDDAKRHLKLSGHDRSSEAGQRLLQVEVSLINMRKALMAKDWDRLLIECSRTAEAGADICSEVLAAKGEALMNLNRANEAMEVLMASKKIFDRSCSKLLLLEIELYFYLGRFEEASQAAEEAIYLDFNRISLMQLKKAWGVTDAHKAGNEYYIAGKYTEACAMFGHALQYVPSNHVLLCKQASSMFKLGQWEKTIEDCNAALKSCPNYSEAILQRAQAHTKIGRWEDAQRDYLLLGKQASTDPAVSKSLREVQTALKGAKCLSKAKQNLAWTETRFSS